MRPEFSEYKLRLLTAKTYSNFVTIGQFLRSSQRKQILGHTDKQTLNCPKATKLTMVHKWKEDLSNKLKKKIGTFI